MSGRSKYGSSGGLTVASAAANAGYKTAVNDSVVLDLRALGSVPLLSLPPVPIQTIRLIGLEGEAGVSIDIGYRW